MYGTPESRVIVDDDGDEMVAPSWYSEDDTASQKAAMAWFGSRR